MLLQEGGYCASEKCDSSKGNIYIKLQPHTKDFLDISNPKAMWVNDFYVISYYSVVDVVYLESSMSLFGKEGFMWLKSLFFLYSLWM